jgi:hypothetical protein
MAKNEYVEKEKGVQQQKRNKVTKELVQKLKDYFNTPDCDGELPNFYDVAFQCQVALLKLMREAQCEEIAMDDFGWKYVNVSNFLRNNE